VRPDTSHVIHEISIQDVQGNWTRVKALIDCGATSIFASPRLIEILGLGTQQAHTTTYGLDGNIRSHVKDSRKTRLSVSYFEHEQPVDESDVLIVPMTAYDLVLGRGLRPRKGYRGLRPRKGYRGLRARKSYRGLRPRKSYRGLRPRKSYRGLRPRKSYHGLRPGKGYRGLRPGIQR
jgi:hypothetical protein